MMGKCHVAVNASFAFATFCFTGALVNAPVESLSNGAYRFLEWFFPERVAVYGYSNILFNSYVWCGICFFLFWLGSLLPDIDSEVSTLGKHFHLPLEHRTWTHSIWFLIPLGVFAWYHPFGRWLFAGYFLHLIFDSVSVAGICFFYPFQKYRKYGSGAFVAKNHRIKLYRSGKISEGVFVVFMVCLFLCVGAYFGFYKYGGLFFLRTWLVA